MAELLAKNITVRAAGAVLVERASFELRQGKLVALLGPNGVGKSTLLRAVLGFAATAGGTATLDGSPVTALSPMARARNISYLPQQRPLAWPNTVRDVVALGRFAHGAALGRLGKTDADAVERALTACDLQALSERQVDTLSGGELARVHFARASAAEAPLLLADEPVAALDPRHQLKIIELIRDFVDGGGGALVVLHDVALAASFADRLLWMQAGRIIADGPPADTLDDARMASVYGVRAQVQSDRDGYSVRILGVQ